MSLGITLQFHIVRFESKEKLVFSCLPSAPPRHPGYPPPDPPFWASYARGGWPGDVALLACRREKRGKGMGGCTPPPLGVFFVEILRWGGVPLPPLLNCLSGSLAPSFSGSLALSFSVSLALSFYIFRSISLYLFLFLVIEKVEFLYG